MLTWLSCWIWGRTLANNFEGQWCSLYLTIRVTWQLHIAGVFQCEFAGHAQEGASCAHASVAVSATTLCATAASILALIFDKHLLTAETNATLVGQMLVAIATFFVLQPRRPVLEAPLVIPWRLSTELALMPGTQKEIKKTMGIRFVM